MTEDYNPSNVVFSQREFEDVTKYLIGNSVRLYPNIIVPQSAGASVDS